MYRVESDQELKPTLNRADFLKKMLAPLGAAAVARYFEMPVLLSALEPVSDPTSIYDFESSFRSQLREFSTFAEYKEYVDNVLQLKLQDELGAELTPLSGIGNLFLHEIARHNTIAEFELKHGELSSNNLIVATKLGYDCIPDRLAGTYYSDISSPTSLLSGEQLQMIADTKSVGLGMTYSYPHERIYLFELS